MEEKEVLFAKWDCPSCGRKGLMGTQTTCSACRTTRPPDIDYYLPKEFKGGWVCPSCLRVNKSGQDKCVSCRTSHPRKEQAAFQKKVQYKEDPNYPRPEKKKKEVLGCSAILVGFGLAILLIIAVIFFPTIKKTATSIFNAVDLLFKKEMKATVMDIKWERTANLFQKKEVTEEGWTVPPDGTLIETFQAIHHREKVHKGYRDGQRTVKVKMPDGKYEERTETYREEIVEEAPVYKLKYKYRVPRWARIGQLIASGRDRNPYWPADARLSDKDNYNTFEKQEKFFLILKLPDGTLADAEVPKQIWQDHVEGMEVKVIKHGISGKFTIDTNE